MASQDELAKHTWSIEPWTLIHPASFDSKQDQYRIIECVNACAGIADPEAEVPQLVAALSQAKADLAKARMDEAHEHAGSMDYALDSSGERQARVAHYEGLYETWRARAERAEAELEIEQGRSRRHAETACAEMKRAEKSEALAKEQEGVIEKMSRAWETQRGQERRLALTVADEETVSTAIRVDSERGYLNILGQHIVSIEEDLKKMKKESRIGFNKVDPSKVPVGRPGEIFIASSRTDKGITDTTRLDALLFDARLDLRHRREDGKWVAADFESGKVIGEWATPREAIDGYLKALAPEPAKEDGNNG